MAALQGAQLVYNGSGAQISYDSIVEFFEFFPRAFLLRIWTICENKPSPISPKYLDYGETGIFLPEGLHTLAYRFLRTAVDLEIDYIPNDHVADFWNIFVGGSDLPRENNTGKRQRSPPPCPANILFYKNLRQRISPPLTPPYFLIFASTTFD